MAKPGLSPHQWSPQKQKKLDRVVQIVGWLLFAASGLSWLAYSVPLWITVCLCLTPWLALALVTFGHGRFRLIGPDHKTVFNIVICVPIGLSIGALLRFNMIEWKWPFVVSCLGGALFVGWCFLASRLTDAPLRASEKVAREKVREWFLVLFVWSVGSALSWATIVFVNGLGESRSPTKLTGRVVGKSVSGGRSRSYFLHLSGEPEALGIDSFRTSRDRYERTVIGQTDCVIVADGLLRLRYYGVSDC